MSHHSHLLFLRTYQQFRCKWELHLAKHGAKLMTVEVSLYFLAPTGALGVTISVCLSVCLSVCYKVEIINLLSSNQSTISQQSVSSQWAVSEQSVSRQWAVREHSEGTYRAHKGQSVALSEHSEHQNQSQYKYCVLLDGDPIPYIGLVPIDPWSSYDIWSG